MFAPSSVINNEG